MHISLELKNISFALLITLIATLFVPTVFPSARLLFFAPFLIILIYQKSFLACLWNSLLCGFILDLLSSNPLMGLYAVSFCLTTGLMYGQRRNFFSDSLSTLPLMTYFFSCLSTLLQLALLYIFGQLTAISWEWTLTDLIYLPALDALYAFCIFILPAVVFGRPQRRGRDYFIRTSTKS